MVGHRGEKMNEGTMLNHTTMTVMEYNSHVGVERFGLFQNSKGDYKVLNNVLLY